MKNERNRKEQFDCCGGTDELPRDHTRDCLVYQDRQELYVMKLERKIKRLERKLRRTEESK